MKNSRPSAVIVRGARQNNLKNLDLDIAAGQLLVVTGVSGSGKSSLVFDTLYAEGQRRYVETFSTYARQFLDRMDKPQVDRIEGIPPAIAIDQVNPVRTSRSTVGTMTELNDHLKLLFARAAKLFCRCCGKPVTREDPESVTRDLMARAARSPQSRWLVTFEISVPANFRTEEVQQYLAAQGYHRYREVGAGRVEVIQDRLRIDRADPSRLTESVEAALRLGGGRLVAHRLAGESGEEVVESAAYTQALACASCDLAYADATPSLFSFNSPLGACETCRGFGRVIGIDYGLVIPDGSKTLRGGAVKPWQTKAFRECQTDLLRYARRRGVDVDRPWVELDSATRQWVIEGEGGFDDKVWYGARRFFAWLESKSYKMHIRVLLSRYRAYTPCQACGGARLKTAALLWRIGGRDAAEQALQGRPRFRPQDVQWNDEMLAALPGLSIHDLMQLPIERLAGFFGALELATMEQRALDTLLGEIRQRLGFLATVGLGYLTLDRQSRTLSGGEVQRINLTTALGTSLVNAMFVLDEPSIGLHSRDIHRLMQVMKKLRDAGNTLLVVEHDPEIMQEADCLLDLGPGPGSKGGEIVYYGEPRGVLDTPNSLTGDYLAARRRIPAFSGGPPRGAAWLRLVGARENNLRDIDFSMPLGCLVCLTGVSGSGKSTLVDLVLYRALRKAMGQPTEAPGEFRELTGAEQIHDVILVDQSAIGRTTRSNPASYVGAFDAIRKLFAAEPLARERKYTAGTFSFNSGTGRCAECNGNGFEHIEMQFLSDVYLRCPACDGRRFRAEVLQVAVDGAGSRRASIADVLAMTVAEAVEFFAAEPEILRRLAPLVAVGLEYLALGQPVPTLSGGEAQRLKLAGHLASASTSERGTLFILDEPTTGLHFEDIARLMRALRQLVERGDSLLVIEHNLDVIAGADWIVDLGPEGGDGGGRIVFAGTPAALAGNASTHTGAALGRYQRRGRFMSEQSRGRAHPREEPERAISVHNAREHNLRQIDAVIPHGRFTVLTGVSGSGKSTLAFDIVFNEGQRRYLESLNAYARQFVQPAARADVDSVTGIPPTVAIEQRTSRGGRRSTVATQTEIYHFLRLLFQKLGTQYCPDCDVAIRPQSMPAIAAQILRRHRGREITLLAPLVVGRKGYYTDLAAWALRKGYGHLRVDGELTPTAAWPRLRRYEQHDIELPVATLRPDIRREKALRDSLAVALDHGKGIVQVLAAGGRMTTYSTLRACPSCQRSFAELDPRLFSFNSPQGWCPACRGTGCVSNDDAEEPPDPEGAAICEQCNGNRLNEVALHVRLSGHSIATWTADTASECRARLGRVKLDRRDRLIARDILPEIRERLGFLERVGLGYLSLARAAPTLSGGEAQRIRLAAQLGSNLKGVCYVLDEPTIGLHPRDNRMLLDVLARLGRNGNTLLVVEHDEDTIRSADHIIDLGPGAGTRGGRVIASGSLQQLMRTPESVTGRAMKAAAQRGITLNENAPRSARYLRIRGAKRNNLRNIDVDIPLHALALVTGVSGSGKSTLTRGTIYENLLRVVGKRSTPKTWLGCRRVSGYDSIDRVLEVDQTPIGKTPRSCPATYVGIWDEIRRVLANTTEARLRGYSASRFSFNTPGGRCPTCEGQGMKRIEMSFLPDVKLPCDACNGLRFDPQTLQVRHRGLNAGEILAMEVESACEFFAAHRRIAATLRLMVQIGLGYLTLGQHSPTLSGGEAQRIKLVAELARAEGSRQHTLYLLDEPTVGLHMADVERLLDVLRRLVATGNSVLIVEHNLQVIAAADHVIDLGPEGGSNGGRIVASGTPRQIASNRASHTGRILRRHLHNPRGTGLSRGSARGRAVYN
ncbi:MAG: excinuclease ABC subunit UvrA [Steroidobacteraceae bacterium]